MRLNFSVRFAFISLFIFCLLLLPLGKVTAADEGWTFLQSLDTAEQLKVYYRVEDRVIKLKWVNANKCQPAEMHFQLKWQERSAFNNKWEDKSTAWKAYEHVNEDSENHTLITTPVDKDAVGSVHIEIIDYKFGEKRKKPGC